jgi:hypothetical protein
MLFSRRAAIKGMLVTTVGAVTGAATYGVTFERHRIGVTHASLSISGLPPALDGLRTGFLTDVHHSRTVPAADLTHAVNLVMAQHPDLVVLDGDYVSFANRACGSGRGAAGSPRRGFLECLVPNGVFILNVANVKGRAPRLEEDTALICREAGLVAESSFKLAMAVAVGTQHLDSTERQVFIDGIRYRYEPVVAWKKRRTSRPNFTPTSAPEKCSCNDRVQRSHRPLTRQA